jgi:hypothetical protein
MAEFLAVIECIAARKSSMDSGGGKSEEAGREPSPPPPGIQISETDLEEQVNDLLEIKKKDILKKNIENILRENLELKSKVRHLEEQLKTATERSGFDPSLSFRIGR